MTASCSTLEFGVVSAGNLFGAQYTYESVPQIRPSLMHWDSYTPSLLSQLLADDRVAYCVRFCGFSFGDYSEYRLRGSLCQFVMFPYGAIVIPLTLLSAWLLLSKPRPAKTTPVPLS